MDSKKLYSALYHVTTKSDQWKALQGIYHKDGELVASNDAAMVIVKCEYLEDLEGAVIKKDGSRWTQTTYPNYKMLIPRQEDLTDIPPYFLHDLIDACLRMPENDDPVVKPEGPARLLDIGGSLFDPELLFKVLNVFFAVEENPAQYIANYSDKRLVLISDNCTAVVVPAAAVEGVKCEIYTVADMLAFGDLL